jgi:glycosyltransferase involved in cell wall biosynthesis
MPLAPSDHRLVLAIVGESHAATAFAMVNAHWVKALRRRGSVTVVAADPSRDSPAAADVTLHHDFTRPFGTFEVPQAGYLVAVRPWDFGPYPSAWVRTLVERYDELWVHTRWIRRQAIRGGVPARRVRVVPLGHDPEVFRPDGPRFRVATNKSTRFLFVGAAVLRKGIDTLIKAWRAAFRPTDDVCLVIKTNPQDTFYRGIDWRQTIRELSADGDAADVVLIDTVLSPARLASLFRSCQASVFPYRAEGFGLPILEAMACGCTPIVPRFGACLDYCDRRSAHFVGARRIRLPLVQRLPFNTLGFEEAVHAVDFCEIPVDALAGALVKVAAMHDGKRRAMADASVTSARRFTWAASAAAVERAVTELVGRGTPVRLRSPAS